MNTIAIIPAEQLEELIQDVRYIKAQINNRSTVMDDLITVDQLREKLGNIHQSTLWRHEKRGILNPIKVGQRKMYRLSEVLAFNATKRKEK